VSGPPPPPTAPSGAGERESARARVGARVGASGSVVAAVEGVERGGARKLVGAAGSHYRTMSIVLYEV
jgi:hypothetical protein